MEDKIEKKRLAILKVLQDAHNPISSEKIQMILEQKGFRISGRTIRYHLNKMDEEMFTTHIPIKGRLITPKGLAELANARAHEKVGFLIARIDQLSHNMNFNLSRMKGTVIINTSLIRKRDLPRACQLMSRVFKAGYAMGKLITLFSAGESVGDVIIPKNYVGIGTVCSVTLNSILLDYRIPVYSRFGGLLQIRESKPTRFVAIIKYNGTTHDPLEIFIKSKMTDYSGATRDGNGQIGASFREIPEGTEEEVESITKKLEKTGLAGILKLGIPGQPLLGIPIGEGRVGLVLIGGLNPVAILVENGMEVESRALSCLIDYQRLFSYDQLPHKIK